ncbi:hypothetical protein SDC9_84700 [bioreactor metagenome]|uniref:Secretion system C-terminal sorting domain-containing protein n=1 Tax=bioreactor metagenome TaxID=1076179 RepID=A0A644ZBK8_9ZZZZ
MSDAGSTGGNWTLSTRAGGYGNSSNSALFDNYNYDAQGSWSSIYAGWDLTNLDWNFLNFDVAYSRYGGQYSDTLEVLSSTDCGSTWQLLYRKGGDELATVPSITDSLFIPEATQWRTDSADMSAFEGENSIIIAFRNIGHWGQGLYIDNIMLNGSTGVELLPGKNHLSLFPNPVESGTKIFISGQNGSTYTLIIFDANGKQIMLTPVAAGQSVSIDNIAPGNYFYKIFSDQYILNGKLIVVNPR